MDLKYRLQRLFVVLLIGAFIVQLSLIIVNAGPGTDLTIAGLINPILPILMFFFLDMFAAACSRLIKVTALYIQLSPCVFPFNGDQCDPYQITLMFGNVVTIERTRDPTIYAFNMSLIQLFVTFYMVALVIIGIYLIFMAGSPHGRSRAKDIFVKLIVGMVLVSQSPVIFQYMLDIVDSLSTGVMNNALATAPHDYSIDNAFMRNNKFCCTYIVFMFVMTLALFVAAIRYFFLYVLAALWPLAIFCYYFEFKIPFLEEIVNLRSIGQAMIRITILTMLTQLFQVFFLAVSLINITITTDSHMHDFILLICSFAGVVFTPLMAMQLLGWVGAVLHFSSTRPSTAMTRFMATMMRGYSAGDALITSSGQTLIGRNLGSGTGGPAKGAGTGFWNDVPGSGPLMGPDGSVAHYGMGGDYTGRYSAMPHWSGKNGMIGGKGRAGGNTVSGASGATGFGSAPRGRAGGRRRTGGNFARPTILPNLSPDFGQAPMGHMPGSMMPDGSDGAPAPGGGGPSGQAPAGTPSAPPSPSPGAPVDSMPMAGPPDRGMSMQSVGEGSTTLLPGAGRAQPVLVGSDMEVRTRHDPLGELGESQNQLELLRAAQAKGLEVDQEVNRLRATGERESEEAYMSGTMAAHQSYLAGDQQAAEQAQRFAAQQDRAANDIKNEGLRKALGLNKEQAGYVLEGGKVGDKMFNDNKEGVSAMAGSINTNEQEAYDNYYKKNPQLDKTTPLTEDQKGWARAEQMKRYVNNYDDRDKAIGGDYSDLGAGTSSNPVPKRVNDFKNISERAEGGFKDPVRAWDNVVQASEATGGGNRPIGDFIKTSTYSTMMGKAAGDNAPDDVLQGESTRLVRGAGLEPGVPVIPGQQPQRTVPTRPDSYPGIQQDVPEMESPEQMTANAKNSLRKGRIHATNWAKGQSRKPSQKKIDERAYNYARQDMGQQARERVANDLGLDPKSKEQTVQSRIDKASEPVLQDYHRALGTEAHSQGMDTPKASQDKAIPVRQAKPSMPEGIPASGDIQPDLADKNNVQARSDYLKAVDNLSKDIGDPQAARQLRSLGDRGLSTDELKDLRGEIGDIHKEYNSSAKDGIAKDWASSRLEDVNDYWGKRQPSATVPEAVPPTGVRPGFDAKDYSKKLNDISNEHEVERQKATSNAFNTQIPESERKDARRRAESIENERRDKARELMKELSDDEVLEVVKQNNQQREMLAQKGRISPFLGNHAEDLGATVLKERGRTDLFTEKAPTPTIVDERAEPVSRKESENYSLVQNRYTRACDNLCKDIGDPNLADQLGTLGNMGLNIEDMKSITSDVKDIHTGFKGSAKDDSARKQASGQIKEVIEHWRSRPPQPTVTPSMGQPQPTVTPSTGQPQQTIPIIEPSSSGPETVGELNLSYARTNFLKAVDALNNSLDKPDLAKGLMNLSDRGLSASELKDLTREVDEIHKELRAAPKDGSGRHRATARIGDIMDYWDKPKPTKVTAETGVSGGPIILDPSKDSKKGPLAGPDGKPLKGAAPTPSEHLLDQFGRPLQDRVGLDKKILGVDGRPSGEGPSGSGKILGADGRPIGEEPSGGGKILGPDGKPIGEEPSGGGVILGPDGKPIRIVPPPEIDATIALERNVLMHHELFNQSLSEMNGTKVMTKDGIEALILGHTEDGKIRCRTSDGKKDSEIEVSPDEITEVLPEDEDKIASLMASHNIDPSKESDYKVVMDVCDGCGKVYMKVVKK